MSRKPVVLVTGAGGEIGQGLIRQLSAEGKFDVLALDIRELDDDLRAYCVACICGDILDQNLLERLVSEFEIHAIFHLAALLSTRAEFTPETGHDVNVGGTLNLLRLAVEQSRWHGQDVRFLFPSSIATHGLPDIETKAAFPRVLEHQWLQPTTMYGCNKLYCEHLGRYFTHYYRQLAADDERRGVDFRSIRFPGLISAYTVPSGGTSDYVPEMIHAAAQGEPYRCFVREDARIPFMAMPDAVDALMDLLRAPKEKLTSHVYNITSYSLSAGEAADLVRAAFPGAEITFEPDAKRQSIVDSWPEDAEDARARADWGFDPKYDLKQTFNDYLLPNIRRFYANEDD